MVKVYIKKIRPKRIEEEVKRILLTTQYRPLKKKIFIKPNISGAYKPTSPCIVNPKIIGGLVEYLRDFGYKEIMIGEHPVSKEVKKVFQVSGYSRLEQKYNVKLIDLSKVEIKLIDLERLKVTLPRFLFDAEYEYINVAKMKTHIQTTVSLCTKNQKGLLTNFESRRKMHTIGDLHENIKSLAQVIKPDYCIIEALNSLEGNGPGRTGREVKNTNIIMCSASMEAIDWAAVQLMNIDPHRVKHLIKPADKVELIGQMIKRKFLLPGDHFQKLNVHFWITDKTCSGCSELIGEFRRKLLAHPYHLIKVLSLALRERIDILTGGIELPKVNSMSKVVCLGNCMKEVARRYNLPIIDGCPPQKVDFSKIFEDD